MKKRQINSIEKPFRYFIHFSFNDLADLGFSKAVENILFIWISLFLQKSFRS